jgi:phospholipase/carboxylesterase
LIALDSLAYRARPATGEPEGALVLFHGRGTDEHDLAPLLDALDPERRLAGYTPRGPLAFEAGRAGKAGTALTGVASERPGPGGAHWYAIRELGYPDPVTFMPTYELASGWLDALAAETGVPPERTVIGGFSQGAVMSHALALGADRPRPAGVIALSGFVPTVEGLERDLERPLPPVAIGHGVFDPVIGVEWGRRAKELYENAGADVLYREYPLPHAVDPDFLLELQPWVRAR